MKVLVSTRETQGARKNDFCFVPAGEILTFGFECDNGHIDDHCGCRRSMVGLHCHKATTTMRLVDLPHITKSKLIGMIEKSWKSAGFTNFNASKYDRIVTAIDKGLKSLPNGSILERRGDNLYLRK